MQLGNRGQGGTPPPTGLGGCGRRRRPSGCGLLVVVIVNVVRARGLVGRPGVVPAAPASSAATVPSSLSVDSFTVDIASTMSTLKGLTGSAGSGLQIGVVLPDTTSSTRWVDFDQPYLTTAFTAAGLSTSQFKIDNAQGSDATELSLATADISAGAKVLVFCPLDGPTGVAVAKLAEQKGVTLIAYDRAIFEGTKTYYVSFDNEKVGELIGNGFNQCLTDWKVPSPQVYVLNGGEDTDPNAISFASGYNKVVFGQSAKTVAAGARAPLAAPRWLPRTSPPAGTTPRAARSSSRRSPPTRRSTPPSRPMTGSPTR